MGCCYFAQPEFLMKDREFWPRIRTSSEFCTERRWVCARRDFRQLTSINSVLHSAIGWLKGKMKIKDIPFARSLKTRWFFYMENCFFLRKKMDKSSLYSYELMTFFTEELILVKNLITKTLKLLLKYICPSFLCQLMF